MDSDFLYEMAFRYKKTKLWNKLLENQIFALELEPGLTGYISIMGFDGVYCAIALYVGEAGLQSFFRLRDIPDEEEDLFERDHAIASMDCLHCAFVGKDVLSEEERNSALGYARRHGIRISGPNAYPMFIRLRPGRVPQKTLTDQEAGHLGLALDAAVWVAGAIKSSGLVLDMIESRSGDVLLLTRKDGGFIQGKTTLPELPVPAYPEGGLCNDVSRLKVQKMKKAGDWTCAVVRMQKPAPWEGDEVPVIPSILLTAKLGSGEHVAVRPVADYETRTDVMLNVFMDAILERKTCPARIIVADDRTEALLRNWCASVKVALVREDEPREELNLLLGSFHLQWLLEDEEFTDLLSEISGNLFGGDESDEPGGFLSNPGKEDQLNSFLRFLTGELEGVTEDGFPVSKDFWSFEEPKPKSRPKRRVPENEKTGSFVISVSLGSGCYRHIQIAKKAKLSELSSAILDAFEFDDDHGHAFFMDNRAYSGDDCYFSAESALGERATNKYRLYDTGLHAKDKFLYLFDFGDDWQFRCRVLREVPENTPVPAVVRQKGTAPDQYGYWEDEEGGDD